MEEVIINTENIMGINKSLNTMITVLKKYQQSALGDSFSEVFSTSLYKSLLPISQTFNQDYCTRILENMKKSFVPLMGIYSNEEYSKILKNIIGINIDFQKTISAFARQQEEILKTKEWSKIMQESFSDFSNISSLYRTCLQDIKIGEVYKILDQRDSCETLSEEPLTEAQKQEVSECFQNDLNNGNCKGFQAKIHDWVEKQKREYYLLYMIVILFLAPYFQQYVALPIMTKVVSYVRELPDKASDVVEKVEKGLKGIATEEQPYWIKITWEDSSGEKKTGWIAKRNIYFSEEEETKETNNK